MEESKLMFEQWEKWICGEGDEKRNKELTKQFAERFNMKDDSTTALMFSAFIGGYEMGRKQ